MAEYLGQAILELRANLGPLAAGLKEAEAMTQRSVGTMQGSVSGSLARQSASMASVGRTMTRSLTVPILGIAGAAAKMAADFNSNMIRIQTNTNASAKQVDALRRGILQMANQVGYAPNELANGMYHVVSALNQVIKPAQRVSHELDVMKIAAEGAKVGHSDLEETTYALVSAIYALHKPTSDAANVMGSLVKIVGAGDMTMADMLDVLRTGLLPTARDFGVSLNSVGAALDVMSNQGMRGAIAGTRLRMAIALLGAPSHEAAKILTTLGLSAQDAAMKTNQMAGLLSDAGVTSTQLAYDMRQPNGIAVALQDLNDRLLKSGLNAEESSAAISRAFGGGRTATAIVTLLLGTKRMNDQFNVLQNSASSFNDRWKATSKTATVQVAQMWAGLQSQFIQLGTKILPDIVSVGKTVVGVVGSVLTFFNSMPPWVRKGILALAAIGPLLRLAGFVTGGLATMTRFVEGVGGRLIAALTGNVRGALGRVGGATAVGTMTVDTMEVLNMVGGGVGRTMPLTPGSTTTVLGRTTAAEATVAAAPAAEATAGVGAAGMLAGVGAMMGKALTFAMPAVTGLLMGAIAQSIIPGLRTGLAGTVGGGAIGAVLGSMTPLGPIGTAIGAGIGATIGPTIGHMLNSLFSSPDYGKEFADQFNKQFDAGVVPHVRAQFDQATKGLGKAIDTATSAAVTPKFGQLPGMPGEGVPAISTKQAEAVAAKTQKVFELAFKGHPISGEAVFKDIQMQLEKMPASMRKYGAEGMLAFAGELESKGKISEADFEKIVQWIKVHAPGISNTLGYVGNLSAANLAKAFKFTDAQNNLHSLLVDVRNTWQDMSINTDATGLHMWKSVGMAMAHLKDTMKTGTAAARAEAEKQFKQLVDSTNKYFGQMVTTVNARISSMATEIQNGSKKAADSANTQWQNVSQSVYAAMAAGVLSTARGAKLIQQNTNAVLKAYGAKQIPLAAIIATEPPNTFDTSGGSGVRGRQARGGPIQVGRPGAFGPDSILGVVGDTPFLVAPGEQVVVLNDRQQRVLNTLAAIGGYGSLTGLFNRENAPHGSTRGRKHATGGYVFPLPSSTTMGRTDMGIDADMAVSAPIGPIGQSRVIGINPGWYQGQPYMWWQLMSGPMSGKMVYLAEEIIPQAAPGQIVSANQAIARYAPSGTGIEMGWAAPGGQTLAQATTGYTEGTATPAGTSFRTFLSGLAHGKILGGMGGMMPQISAPRVLHGGTYGRVEQQGMNRDTAAANAMIARRLAALMPTGNFMGGIAPGQGPVEKQMLSAGLAIGENKIAIAGAIGNAMMESSLNPDLNVPRGRGLFSWDPVTNPAGASQVVLGNVPEQMSLATSALPGGVGAFDRAATSPAAAASWFEQNFERAAGGGDLPKRMQFAQQAYAQGFARGGSVRHKAPKGRSPHHRHHKYDDEFFKKRYPKVYAFIKRMSPYFPPKDLGPREFSWLSHLMNFNGINPAGITHKFLSNQLDWVGHVMNVVVPRLQEEATQLANFYQNRPMPHHIQGRITSLDRQSVAWLLRAAHTIRRLEPPIHARLAAMGAKVGGAGAKQFQTDLHSALHRAHQQYATLTGISGMGGTLADAEQTLMGQLGQTSQPGQHAAALLALEREREQKLRTQLSIMRSQYSVLNQMPPPLPIVGPYHQGGVVPGPPSRESLALVRGQETIIPHDRPAQVHVVIDPKYPEFARAFDARIEGHSRGTARRASYTLPSAGGR